MTDVAATATAAAGAIDAVKLYGEGDTEIRALDGVTVAFERSRFTAIMGPSGSGKSTLMHCLAGLDVLSNGKVYVGDTYLDSLSEAQLTELRRDRLGFIFQAFNLIPTLSAEENITLPMDLAGRKYDQPWLDQVIDTVGLRPRLGHRPSELSGGQQQRVAVARALASQPEIVFADEPTGNLDSRSGSDLLEFMRHAVDDLEQTIVMVTHDPGAAAHADRVVFLADGQIRDEMIEPTAPRVLDLMKQLGTDPLVLRVALKDLFARKRRLVTTSIAIVLGIAFLTGTQLLSTTLSDSVESLIGDVYKGIDAVVRSPDTQETPLGQPLRAPVPAELVDTAAAVEGVRTAEGFVESTGPQLVDDDGKVVGGGFGPPTLVYNWLEDDELRTGRLVEGRGPTSDDEIAFDFNTRDELGAELGDSVTLATTQAGTEEYVLVGVLGLGEEGDQQSGATPLFFTTATAMRLVEQPGEFNFVAVAAEEGTSQQQLADSLAAAIPDQQVLTGEVFTEENQESIGQFVDILGTFVSVFGYIALFVAIFIIYNTFSIIITQRTRETALLRAVGARRRQVLGATMLEAVIVGFIAAVLGLAAGVALSALLISVIRNFFTVSSGIPTLTVGTVLTALVIGVGVTTLSAFIPALRSSKIPPIAALSESSQDRSGLSVARKVWGTLLLAAGIALMALGLSDVGSNPLLLVGAGAAAVLASVAVILGPLIAAPVSRLLARLVSWRGNLTSRLAGENAARNPKRTASTAAALTVGVTLVVVIAIVASSIRATFDATIADSVRADYIVATASVTSFGQIPADLQERVAELDDVRYASPVRFSFIRLLDDASQEDVGDDGGDEIPEGLLGVPDTAPEGDDDFILGIDPQSFFEVVDHGELQGSVDDLGDGTMAVNADYAEDRDWRLGDRIPVYFGATGEQELEVALLYDRDVGQGDMYLPLGTFSENTLPTFDVDAQIYVQAVDGADIEVLGAQLDELVVDLPTVAIQDLGEFIEAQTGPINTFLGIVYALLALAILIALIGITNTLSLSVLERTRELGMLRAVGMTRGQLKRMVRTEAAIIAVFGTLIGLVIGIIFSIALTVAISADTPDLFTYSLPIVQLVVITVCAALAGLLAAWLPARRAANLNVLDAISSV